jgi:hypothetical protein
MLKAIAKSWYSCFKKNLAIKGLNSHVQSHEVFLKALGW